MGHGADEAQPRDDPGQRVHPGPVFTPDRVACPRRRLSHATLAVAALLVLLAVPGRTFAQTNGCDGSAPEVAKVSFEGNKAVPSQTLEATIETAPSSGARRFTRLFGTPSGASGPARSLYMVATVKRSRLPAAGGAPPIWLQGIFSSAVSMPTLLSAPLVPVVEKVVGLV